MSSPRWATCALLLMALLVAACRQQAAPPKVAESKREMPAAASPVAKKETRERVVTTVPAPADSLSAPPAADPSAAPLADEAFEVTTDSISLDEDGSKSLAIPLGGRAAGGHRMALRGAYGGTSRSERRPIDYKGIPADQPPAVAGQDGEFNTEAYARIKENPFLAVSQNPLSTFSIDVDTASYANVRRFLTQGMLPPPDAVRIEELINYFSYAYDGPKDDKPFATHLEVAACPWNGEHRLVRVGIKGKEIDLDKRPASNLVFLLDVSGSMDEPNKLPLVKESMRLLVEKLNENDRVAMVVYAGASGLVLESTPGDRKETILPALDNLQAGGSTNGGQGIQLAYDVAVQNFLKGGTNRVILCTDGDFNVGVTNEGELTRLIEDKAKSGVFLSVLGFGTGNYKDAMMEKLADQGNGNYGYVDTISEGRKVLVEQMTGTLITIAKDVKIQIEFNPAKVSAYRLIGYENRMLRAEDFKDDKKDAGEIGAGHTVTALYEIVPAGKEIKLPDVDALKYQKSGKLTDEADGGELLTVKLRYKAPDSDTSTPIEFPLADGDAPFGKASPDFKFAAAVAGFGMLLRDSEHKAGLTLDAVSEIASECKGPDPNGYRTEFLQLVAKAKELKR